MSLNVSHDDLAARLEQHARIHDEHVPFDSEQARWAADLRAAAEVVRGASAQPQAAGWRPIETAPRDGTRIMVSNGIGVWFAEWHQFASSGFRFADPWRSMMLNHDHIEHPHRYKAPTHWQPLPEPPKEGE